MNTQAFTLLEFMVVITIVCALAFLSVIGIEKTLMRNERECVLNTLETSIEYAKNEALRSGKKISLCLSPDKRVCYPDKGTSFIVYAEEGILETSLTLQYGELRSSNFGNDVLTLEPDGRTLNNGSFLYCPKNRDAREGGALILNQAGRIYRPRTRNAEGVLILLEGTPEARALSCR